MQSEHYWLPPYWREWSHLSRRFIFRLPPPPSQVGVISDPPSQTPRLFRIKNISVDFFSDERLIEIPPPALEKKWQKDLEIELISFRPLHQYLAWYLSTFSRGKNVGEGIFLHLTLFVKYWVFQFSDFILWIGEMYWNISSDTIFYALHNLLLVQQIMSSSQSVLANTDREYQITWPKCYPTLRCTKWFCKLYIKIKMFFFTFLLCVHFQPLYIFPKWVFVLLWGR